VPLGDCFGLIGKQVCQNIGLFGGRIKSAEELSLHVFSQAAALAAALDHLVGDLLGGGCHHIVRLQFQFR